MSTGYTREDPHTGSQSEGDTPAGAGKFVHLVSFLSRRIYQHTCIDTPFDGRPALSIRIIAFVMSCRVLAANKLLQFAPCKPAVSP